jgi:hypothetical protein
VALININPPPGAIIGSYVETYVNLSTPAGTLTVTFSTVPAGEVWVIESACCWDYTTDIAMAKIRKNSGGVAAVVANINPAGVNDAAQIFVPVTLFPGEFLDFQLATVVLNDDCFAHASGVKYAIELF